MKFQTKKVIVDAEQWFPPGHPQHNPLMLTTYQPGEVRKMGDLSLLIRGGVPGIGGEDIYSILAPSGQAAVYPGDWIITGPRTDIVDKYPCDPVTFAAKYEPVT